MDFEPGAIADWVDRGAVTALLETAAALPINAPSGALEELAAALRAFGDGVDVAQARRCVTPDEPRALIGSHVDGTVIALRLYAPGEVSTVHSHPWTILIGLDGDGTLERWETAQPGVAGAPATLVRCERTGPRPLIIREEQLHRQRTSVGALELVMLRDYSDNYVRTDYTPEPADDARSAFIDRYVNGWAASDIGVLRPLFDDDVFLDVHVPRWRTQVAGRDMALKMIETEEFQPDYRLEGWCVSPTPEGFVFELNTRFTFGAGEGSAEMLHRAGMATPSGPIVDYTVYCTGIWDEATREGLRQSGGLLRP